MNGIAVFITANGVHIGIKTGVHGKTVLTRNGITISRDPTPYTIFRKVRLYGADPTSVPEIQSDDSTGKTYNLSGLEVDAGHNGLTISNGRKVLVR